MGFVNTVTAILIKDLVSEFRTRQVLPAMVVLAVLMSWIFRIAGESTVVDNSVTAAAVLLVALLFSAILAGEKSFSVEQQNDCTSALLLAAADAGDIYIGKLLVNIALLCIFEIVTVPAVFVLFNVNAAGRGLELVTVLLLVNIAMSGVATLLGCVIQTARSAAGLLSILVMAVLCPMMIPAVLALLLLLQTGGSSVAAAGVLAPVIDFQTAVGFLTAFDAIFVTVGWLLFGFVIKE